MAKPPGRVDVLHNGFVYAVTFYSNGAEVAVLATRYDGQQYLRSVPRNGPTFHQVLALAEKEGSKNA